MDAPLPNWRQPVPRFTTTPPQLPIRFPRVLQFWPIQVGALPNDLLDIRLLHHLLAPPFGLEAGDLKGLEHPAGVDNVVDSPL